MIKPRKSHCLRGHESTPQARYKDGQCKECCRIRAEANKDKRAAVRKAKGVKPRIPGSYIEPELRERLEAEYWAKRIPFGPGGRTEETETH